jgi:hypothetical protein
MRRMEKARAVKYIFSPALLKLEIQSGWSEYTEVHRLPIALLDVNIELLSAILRISFQDGRSLE